MLISIQAGRKLEENRIRNKEKAADAKKIQDLERQASIVCLCLMQRYDFLKICLKFVGSLFLFMSPSKSLLSSKQRDELKDKGIVGEE